jgi:UTP-glucose-1-phosphate uridylyltransferase
LMKKRKVLGYFFTGRRFDAGTNLGYIETLIHVALHREDTREFTRRILRELAKNEKL